MTAQPNAERDKLKRQKVSTILQWSGIADVVIGVVLAVLMPSLLPGDPVSVRLGIIACGVLALSGVGVWAFGRFVFGKRVEGQQAGTVERRGR